MIHCVWNHPHSMCFHVRRTCFTRVFLLPITPFSSNRKNSRNASLFNLEKIMLTKLKLFFCWRDHKNSLWSQLLFFETSFRLFRKMDIYKCPKTSFPKKSWEKKHKFAKKTINGKSNLKNQKVGHLWESFLALLIGC